MGEREKQYKGTISYQKLFDLMAKKGIKKRELRETYKISPTIINRLNNNSNVAVDTIMYLCEILDCQPDDIMEYIPPENNMQFFALLNIAEELFYYHKVYFYVLLLIMFDYFCVLLPFTLSTFLCTINLSKR